MILAALLLGAVCLTLAAFWDDIKNFLIKGIEKVKQMVGFVVYGSKVFIEKMYDAYKEIARHYSQDQHGKWHETTVTKEIPESEVPKEIREKAYRNQEVDITNEVEEELKLVV